MKAYFNGMHGMAVMVGIIIINSCAVHNKSIRFTLVWSRVQRINYSNYSKVSMVYITWLGSTGEYRVSSKYSVDLLVEEEDGGDDGYDNIKRVCMCAEEWNGRL
ncbi:hypothetical protein BU24DRAFT_51155 [Aaosphaeria arxii CBS 175.79]|uniref:Uncharacterized protein n=1 Tax=Aaosphaeria arxii CBS 175.79 TaxID=1450172 RepID=A0A6A5XDW5_9PLEO|nr:uncharacterized protein BU24DRAFT_51155 [Aaosphaeria arxii CBS 175.79]KAF2011016.1 hypothetical protein BU24DRAFT_51155 [Aaosphaeria arxii CBS 175.79]